MSTKKNNILFAVNIVIFIPTMVFLVNILFYSFLNIKLNDVEIIGSILLLFMLLIVYNKVFTYIYFFFMVLIEIYGIKFEVKLYKKVILIFLIIINIVAVSIITLSKSYFNV